MRLAAILPNLADCLATQIGHWAPIRFLFLSIDRWTNCPNQIDHILSIDHGYHARERLFSLLGIYVAFIVLLLHKIINTDLERRTC